MYRFIRTKPIFVLVILTLSLVVAACSPSAEKLNKEGNSAYAKQAYEEALSAYQFAQIESPELAEPYYNAANSLYRQGMYAEALEQLSQALSYAKEETLAENSFYNLGNSSFSTQEWENAIEAYKEALLLNPDDLDAKYNLELALQQQEQQEEQEQDQEQNQDQEQSQDTEDGENENEDQDQSQSEGDQGEQEQDSQSSDQGENQDDQSENDENQEDGSDQDNAGENQDQNGEQGKPQDNDAQNQGQPSQSGQVPAPGQRMTEEQAKQLLAALAQDMQTLQERLGQILFVRELPPIQDW